MLPYIELFGRVYPTYGILGAVGVLLGLWISLLRCKRFGLSRDDCSYIYVWGVIGALAGAKLLYLITVLPKLIADFHLIWENFDAFSQRYLAGGLVFYGGLCGAVAGAAICARTFRKRLRDFFPILVPALPLIHAVGRIGCFCAGCCYGIRSDRGIAFTESIAAPNGVKLLPIQLYECAAELLICGVLMWISSRSKQCDMRLLGVYFLLYAPVRFVLEFFRGDVERGYVLALSTSQWISLIIFAVGLTLLYRNKKSIIQA